MKRENIELEINKTHTLCFEVTISGQNIFSKSKISFIIIETNSGKEWIFPSNKTKGGGVEVDIPIMKDIVSFTEIYLGDLKVVIENNVFYPVRANIVFVDSSLNKANKIPSTFNLKHKGFKKMRPSHLHLVE